MTLSESDNAESSSSDIWDYNDLRYSNISSMVNHYPNIYMMNRINDLIMSHLMNI